MNFNEFQNQARLYVIGALESEELEEFENARKKFGKVSRKGLSGSNQLQRNIIARSNNKDRPCRYNTRQR